MKRAEGVLACFALRTFRNRRVRNTDIGKTIDKPQCAKCCRLSPDAVMVQTAVAFANDRCQSAQDSSSAQAGRALDLVYHIERSYMRLGHDLHRVMGARFLTPCLCIFNRPCSNKPHGVKLSQSHRRSLASVSSESLELPLRLMQSLLELSPAVLPTQVLAINSQTHKCYVLH